MSHYEDIYNLRIRLDYDNLDNSYTLAECQKATNIAKTFLEGEKHVIPGSSLGFLSSKNSANEIKKGFVDTDTTVDAIITLSGNNVPALLELGRCQNPEYMASRKSSQPSVELTVLSGELSGTNQISMVDSNLLIHHDLAEIYWQSD